MKDIVGFPQPLLNESVELQYTYRVIGREIAEDNEPWEWLKACVTQNGSGYALQSPAGGRLEITDEQRRRIVASVELLKALPLEAMEAILKDGEKYPHGPIEEMVNRVMQWVEQNPAILGFKIGEGLEEKRSP